MNERIRELANEAGLPTYNPEGVPTKIEKFAELIIRECLDITSKVSKNPYIPDGDQAGKINREIKKRFRVE